jgi:hypothetical protein
VSFEYALAHLEWIKDQCPDIALSCTFELVHGLGCGDTCDDDKPFLFKSEDQRKRHRIVTAEYN